MGAVEPTADESATAAPYRGAESYGSEHRHLFFGRTADTTAMAAVILSHRLSLLHAASGAGKTSLLAASLVPELEDRGCVAIIARPETSPSRQLKLSALAAILPQPSLEVAAARRAARGVGRSEDSLTLLELKQLVKALPESSAERVQVLAPLRTLVDWPFLSGRAGVSVRPVVTRFLQIEKGHWALARHVLAIDTLAPTRFWHADSVSDLCEELASTSLSRLCAFFERAETQGVHEEVVAFCAEPNLSLALFFERVFRLWAPNSPGFSPVIVLDQFEELFTRFVDQRLRGELADDGAPHVSAREEYFRELGQLLEHQVRAVDEPHEALLPTRVVLSMRDDYIARIDELEQFTGGIDSDARYHLQLLRVADAASAIAEPARMFKFEYDPAVFDEILSTLPTEEDRVEPGHIQVICERLWTHAGAKAVSFDEFKHSLGGVLGILDSHFTVFLNAFDPFDVYEILDLLEPLVTLDRRRNIVQRDVLLRAPFRDAQHRERLLEQLRGRRVVRVEWRLGGAFVEVTHEFLIAPIHREISMRLRAEPRFRELADAMRELERARNDGWTRNRTLTGPQVEALLWFFEGQRRRAQGAGSLGKEARPTGNGHGLDSWATETIYRDSIANGLQLDALTSARRLHESAPTFVLLGGSDEVLRRLHAGQLLDPIALQWLAQAAPVVELEPEHQRLVLQSVLVNGPADGHLVAQWFRRLAS